MKLTPDQVIKNIITQKNGAEFIPTGFKKMDDYLDGGFMRKELVIVGAATGTGKSILGGQLALNNARKGFKTAYFSLEISNEMVVGRMLGQLANIKPTSLMYSPLSIDQHEKKLDAEAELISLGELISFYDDVYELKEIESECLKNKYEFVVIDFLQNVIAPGESEYTRLNGISIRLQKLAKKTSSCILALSQLSNVIAREGNKNKSVEFRGSGSLAHVCDMGFFFVRDFEQDNTSWLTLSKNRRGKSWVKSKIIYEEPGGRLREE